MRWEEAEVSRIDGFESQVLDLGEMVCVRHLISAGFDSAPLYRGLPDDMCPCEHWCYLVKGRLRYRFVDWRRACDPGWRGIPRPSRAPCRGAGECRTDRVHRCRGLPPQGGAPRGYLARKEMSGTHTSTHRARVIWDSEGDDVRAHTVELGDQRLDASSAVEFGGDPDKANPEEMFVAALSSCHMLWFLALARAEGVRVTSYEDDPEGTMDSTRFTYVVLRPRVVFDRDLEDEQIRSLHHRAHERCFIANSVSCPVEVEPR
jgi:organic hydroperoxide reductase OsmC/OhrA